MTTYLPESEFPQSRNGWFDPYDSILQLLFDKYLLSLFESGVFKRIMETHDSKKLECPVNLALMSFDGPKNLMSIDGPRKLSRVH